MLVLGGVLRGSGGEGVREGGKGGMEGDDTEVHLVLSIDECLYLAIVLVVRRAGAPATGVR